MSDLREQIAAAMAGTPEPEAAPAPEIQTPVEANAAPEPVETPQPEAQEGQPREKDGKFAPKVKAEAEAPAGTEPPAEAPAESASPANEEPPQEAIRVPPSLPAAVKAKFKDLDPDIREAFAKLEDSVQTAKAEWGAKGERLNAYEAIIAPHRDAWALQGLDDRQALQRLVAAEKVLRETPAQGIVALAQLYGVNLLSLVGQGNPAAQAPQQPQPGAMPSPEEHPAYRSLMQEFQTLKASLEQRSQAETDARLASARDAVAEFAGKPENMYFENVKDQVAALLENGAAKDLQTAYDMAIWASPEIRPLLLREQEASKAKKAAEDAQRAKAAQAKAASGSVTGAPTPGATAPATGPRPSLREELLAAHEAVSGAL